MGLTLCSLWNVGFVVGVVSVRFFLIDFVVNPKKKI